MRGRRFSERFVHRRLDDGDVEVAGLQRPDVRAGTARGVRRQRPAHGLDHGDAANRRKQHATKPVRRAGGQVDQRKPEAGHGRRGRPTPSDHTDHWRPGDQSIVRGRLEPAPRPSRLQTAKHHPGRNVRRGGTEVRARAIFLLLSCFLFFFSYIPSPGVVLFCFLLFSVSSRRATRVVGPQPTRRTSRNGSRISASARNRPWRKRRFKSVLLIPGIRVIRSVSARPRARHVSRCFYRPSLTRFRSVVGPTAYTTRSTTTAVTTRTD